MTLLDMLTKRADSKENASLNFATPISVVSFPDQIYGLSVRNRKVLVSSFIRHSNENHVMFEGRKFLHRLPASKVMWSPVSDTSFGSISTSLRIWKFSEEKPVLKLQSSGKSGTGPSPLTSFDWHAASPTRVATCAIDTTVTIWDIERGKMDTQMIAHDKAVFDVAYAGASNPALFATVSEDGSMRLFDMRDLDHSTIVYEGSAPLLRLVWGQQNANTIAAIASEANELLLFDMRKTGFKNKSIKLPSCPNAIAWSDSAILSTALADGSVVAVDTDAASLKTVGIFPTPAVNLARDGNSLAVAHGSSVSIISN